MNQWIMPYFQGREQQRSAAQQTNTDQSLQTLQATLSGIQELLTRQERALENVKQEVTALQLEQQTSTGRENYAIHELKSEIISLKGLMLNRNQFTPPPRLSAISSGIPSWQRNAKLDACAPSQPVSEVAKSEENRTTLEDDTKKEETREEA
jgi:peroxin-14